MTDTRVATTEPDGAHTLEQVVIVGDLAKLSPQDRVMYYQETCRSLGLNPLTKPFQYIVLNNRLTLYATRTATDQLRGLKGISIDRVEQVELGELYVATVYGHDRDGRTDSEVGAVPIANLKGENRANAIMKAITKAKRRLTLSLAGLGWLDETEVGSIPSAQAADVDMETGEVKPPPPSIAETVAARRAAISSGTAAGLAPRPVGPETDTPPPSPADPAGALAATPDLEPGADQGEPTPAPEPCEGFSPELGRCVREGGHKGNHANKAKETWA
jgi:hypothetical protein